MKIIRRISSRNDDGSVTFGPTRPGSSRIRTPGSSRLISSGSSRLEDFDRGGLYVPPIPIVLEDTIQVVVTSPTTATVTWDLDPGGPAGYHRVQWGLVDPGDHQTGYSPGASYSASVGLTGLTPERTGHSYQVQSCISPGSGCSLWSPAETPLFFFTTCVTPLTYSSVDLYIDPGVTMTWTSNTAQKHRTRWRNYPSGTFNSWTAWSGLFVTSHEAELAPTLIPASGKTYQAQIQGQNRCNDLGPTPNYLIQYSEGRWRTIAQ